MVDTPTQPGSPYQAPETDRAAEFYKAYEEHSKVLRAWLVAYGVDAPGCASTPSGILAFGNVQAGLLVRGNVLHRFPQGPRA